MHQQRLERQQATCLQRLQLCCSASDKDICNACSSRGSTHALSACCSASNSVAAPLLQRLKLCCSASNSVAAPQTLSASVWRTYATRALNEAACMLLVPVAAPPTLLQRLKLCCNTSNSVAAPQTLSASVIWTYATRALQEAACILLTLSAYSRT